MVRRRILRGAALLSSGQLLGRACTFGRTAILARMLGPEDWGIGATFALTAAGLEMISDLSAGQLIIQAKDGENPRLQATAHTFHLLRGIIVAMLIFAVAPLIANLFHAPEATWAYRWLAIIPLIRGMYNLDILRLQREMNYGPDAFVFFTSEFIGLLAAWPAAVLIGNYSAVLVVVSIQVSVWSLLTHLVAKRRFELAWDRELFGRMLTFGWPLLINGLLLFLVFQGDKVIVGSEYGPASLGLYAAAVALTLTPTMVVARIASGMVMPLLSRVQDETGAFVYRYRLASEAIGVVGGVFGVGCVLMGPAVVLLVYGEEYTGAGVLVAFLGAAQGLRVLRIAPTIAAMARADTKTTLYTNIARSIGVGLALAAAMTRQELWVIAASGVAGEVFALVFAMGRLNRIHHVPLSGCLIPSVLAVLAIGSAAAVVRFEDWAQNVWIAAGLTAAISAVLGLTMLGLSPRWRAEMVVVLKAVRKGRNDGSSDRSESS